MQALRFSPFLLALLVVVSGCGGSSTSSYKAPNHTFSLSYPSDWSVRAEHFPNQKEPDYRFYKSSNKSFKNLIMSVRADPNVGHYSAHDYILYRIMLAKPQPKYAKANAKMFQSLNTTKLTVHHHAGLAYTSEGEGQTIKVVVVPAHGRMYLIFGFEQDGIKQLPGVLKSFSFA